MREAFPWALARIRQGACGGCPYDFSCLSYVLYPLLERFSLGTIVEAARALAALCNLESGGTLILQDKFHEYLLEGLCRRLGIGFRRTEMTQIVYDTTNTNGQQSYSFCSGFLAASPSRRGGGADCSTGTPGIPDRVGELACVQPD